MYPKPICRYSNIDAMIAATTPTAIMPIQNLLRSSSLRSRGLIRSLGISVCTSRHCHEWRA
ncbi:Uncharacterised protein [Mycobacteroides abscessus subsp. abscessus]|nr:Uncharacterised protein [Mycobacteroides abscessus subsp. abscessus]